MLMFFLALTCDLVRFPYINHPYYYDELKDI